MREKIRFVRQNMEAVKTHLIAAGYSFEMVRVMVLRPEETQRVRGHYDDSYFQRNIRRNFLANALALAEDGLDMHGLLIHGSGAQQIYRAKLRKTELHHCIPASLLPVDLMPARETDALTWWREAASDPQNLAAVDRRSHANLHRYIDWQLRLMGALESVVHPVVWLEVPMKEGSLWVPSPNKPIAPFVPQRQERVPVAA